MGGFVVQDNIPIARKAVSRQRSLLREALANLEIGQCVTVFPEAGQSMKALRARLSGLTQGAKQDNPEAHYIHRTVDAQDPSEGEGAPVRKAIRIWRVSEETAEPKSSGKKAAATSPPPRGQETGAEVPDSNLASEEETEPEPADPSDGSPEPALTDAEAAAEEQLDAESEAQEEADPDDPFDGELDEEGDEEEEDTGEEEEDPDDLDRPVSFPNL